jgi:hypothetical protein
MHTILRALLRPAALVAISLGTASLLGFTAAPAAATPVVPVITNVTITPGTIPAAGGVFTVTAQVQASTSGLSSVTLYETYDNTNQIYRTAPMTLGSDGITYAATIPVDVNTNSNANGRRLFVEAKDPANNVVDATAATQGYDNIAPIIASVAYGPNPLPIQGANVTVTAAVSDAGVGLSSVVLYETYDNSNQTDRTAPMAVSGDGVTCTATVPVDLNSASGTNGERLYIVAIDLAGNQTSFSVATQGYSSVPATGSLPVLISANPAAPVLSPAFVTDSGGVTLPLTISGINFAAGATVLFNGLQLPAASQTGTQIVVNVPASLIAQAGSYPVNVVDPSPSGVSNSVNFIVKANATTMTHINWTNTDGRLSLWNYNPLSGGFTQITYGPYPGWSAKAVADGPDGKTRVLWDNTNGTMSLWSLDNTTGIFSENSFGPYAGWTATSLSVAP